MAEATPYGNRANAGGGPSDYWTETDFLSAPQPVGAFQRQRLSLSLVHSLSLQPPKGMEGVRDTVHLAEDARSRVNSFIDFRT